MIVCEENPVTTIPIKKRNNAALFIDKRIALYIGETQIRDRTIQQNGTIRLEECVYLMQNGLV